MAPPRIAAVLLGLALAAACDSPSAGDPPDARSAPVQEFGARRALLIGIDAYEGTDDGRFARLVGTLEDVAAIERLLRSERFGFQDVTVLRNRDATLEGVVLALHRLSLATEPGDEVVVFFAGHGSRVADASLRESTGDSTFVAIDSRVGERDGEWDLPDDALHALLSPIWRKGAWLNLWTDACHSQGLLRGEGLAGSESRFVGRAAPAGTRRPSPERWSFWPRGVEVLDDDARTVGVRSDVPPRYTHLAACQKDQIAAEDRQLRRGLFSMLLEEELLKARPVDTWLDVAERVDARMVELRGDEQEVSIDGEPLRRVFGSGFAPPRPGFAVRPGLGSTLRVDAGRLACLVPETRLEVRALDGEEIGEASVVESSLGRAVARWVGGRRPPGFVRGRRAYVVTRPEDATRLAVRCTNAAMRELVRSSPWLRSVEGEAPFVLRGDIRSGVCTGISFEGPRGRLWHADAGTDRDACSEQLDEVGRRELTCREIFAWGGRDEGDLGDLELEVAGAAWERRPGEPAWEAAQLEASEDDPRAFSVRAPTKRERGERRVMVRFDVVNETLTEAFVYLFNVTERGTFHVQSIDGDQTLDGDAGRHSFYFVIHAPDDGAQARDEPLVDRYIAVATKSPIPTSQFARVPADGMRGEDLEVRPLGRTDWVSAHVDLHVRDEARAGR